MSTRSNGLTYRRSARIPPPTFLPTAGNTNVPNNPPFDRHSTYSEILQAYSATDLSNSDSVQEYDDWIKSHREKNQNKMYLDEKVEVGPSTAQLIKGYSRKAKKVAKVDKFKAFQEGLDEPLQQWHQHHIRVVDSQRSMRAISSKKKEKKKERAPTKMEDLLEGQYRCLEILEVPEMEEKKVDINDALNLRPILSPDDAKAIQTLVKGQKNRLKPYFKKYSAGLLDDPIWNKWAEEDQRLKGRITRMKPPLIAQHLPMEHGPASLEEIRIMVDNTAQLPEYEYQHKQGQLGGIVPERLDPLDTGLLHHIDPPVYHPLPILQSKKESRPTVEQEKRPPISSRAEMELMEMEIQATYQQQQHQNDDRHRKSHSQRFRVPVPNVSGVYDQTHRSYPEFLSEHGDHDPWIEKVRGIGNLTSSLDWNSAFINDPQQYRVQAAGCDTEKHRNRYGTPTTVQPKPRTIGSPRLGAPKVRVSFNRDHLDVETTHPSASQHEDQGQRPNGNGGPKRKRIDDAPVPEQTQGIDPRLDMPALRDIVLIPEAKIDHKRIRTVEPMASAHEVTNFFADLFQPTSKALTVYDKTKKQVPNQNQNQQKTVKVKTKPKPDTKPQPDWKKHKSIQNPKWYASSLRLSTSRENEPIPIYLANSVLQIRPVFLALESVNFNPVELESPTIQHVDLILSPSTGVIFTSLAKLSLNHGKLIQQIKAAAFYFTRVVVVLEVVPYRLFKDPRSLEEFDPMNEAAVKVLSTFKRTLEMSVNSNSEEGLVGQAELAYAINGAQEVASMLRGIAIKLDNGLLKDCKGDTLSIWQDKPWTNSSIDQTQQEYLIAAGFNLYSTHFILRLCGSFRGFAEGMTAKARLEKVAPVVGQKVVTRFNAKWWRRQMEARQLQIEPATSETLHSG